MSESTRRELLVAGVATLAGALVPLRLSEAKMIEPLSPSEELMYCTARIVGLNAAGQETKFGTGFFYQFPVAENDDRKIPMLVTNNHVVQGATKTYFVMHTNTGRGAKPDGNTQVLSNASEWIPHPNPQIDLCAVPIGGFLNKADPPAFWRSLDPSLIPTGAQLDELTAGSQLILLAIRTLI